VPACVCICCMRICECVSSCKCTNVCMSARGNSGFGLQYGSLCQLPICLSVMEWSLTGCLTGTGSPGFGPRWLLAAVVPQPQCNPSEQPSRCPPGDQSMPILSHSLVFTFRTPSQLHYLCPLFSNHMDQCINVIVNIVL
jgi:hypothetical protein